MYDALTSVSDGAAAKPTDTSIRTRNVHRELWTSPDGVRIDEIIMTTLRRCTIAGLHVKKRNPRCVWQRTRSQVQVSGTASIFVRCGEHARWVCTSQTLWPMIAWFLFADDYRWYPLLTITFLFLFVFGFWNTYFITLLGFRNCQVVDNQTGPNYTYVNNSYKRS